MKKALSFFLILSVASMLGYSQDTKQAISPNAPEITFENEVHDFGTIDYAGDGTYSFKFTNTGKEPLIISDCKGSCGCTVPKWPREPIMKGQSNYINVSYDTKRPGPFTKTVTVNSNAGKNPNKVITIKGVVKSAEQTEDQMPVRKNNGLSPLENAK